MTTYTSNSRVSFDEVKNNVPLREMIDYFQLARKGRAFRCPNSEEHKHGDRNRSAYIAGSWDSWRCYGCQAYGSVIDIYRYVYKVSKDEARDALAEYAGLAPAYGAVTKAPPPKPPEEIVRVPLSPEAPLPPAAPDVQAFLRQVQDNLVNSLHANEYLDSRGIDMAIARAAGLGYAPRGTWLHARGAGQPRIIAPLTTPDGTLINLYGRSTVHCEKSLRHDFLPGPKGIFHARSLTEEGVVVVEGVFDALSCLNGGHPSAAIMGLSIRDGWWVEMGAHVILLAPDADEAGQRRREELQKIGAQAEKTVFTLRPNCLAGIKDMNEFWVKNRRLPKAIEKFFRVYLPREVAKHMASAPAEPRKQATTAIITTTPSTIAPQAA